MATTGITIQLNAVDQTAAAVEAARGRFVAMQQSISARSATISESGKKALSGWEQFGARIIGIRYAFQSISAIAMRATEPFRRLTSEMHELTDRADEIGASASDILRLSGAFGKLGIKNAGIEDITRLFNFMRKNTGDAGVEGFKRQMAAIAGIADETERAKELTRVFGREGVRLWSLAANGPEAFRRTVENAMATVTVMSDHSIRTASQTHKAFAWVAADVKSKWDGVLSWWLERLTGVGENAEMQVALWWSNFKASAERLNATVGSILGFIKDGVVQLVRFNILSTWNVIKTIGGIAAEFGKQFWDLITGGDFDTGPIVARLKRGIAEMPKFELDMSGTVYQGMIDAIDERQREEEEAIRAHFADKIGAGPAREFEELESAGVSAGRAISNAFAGVGHVMAGTAEALKLTLLHGRDSAGGLRSAVAAARSAVSGSQPASRAAAPASQDSRNIASLLSRLTDLLSVQRDGWAVVGTTLSGLEVV